MGEVQILLEQIVHRYVEELKRFMVEENVDNMDRMLSIMLDSAKRLDLIGRTSRESIEGHC